MDAQIIKKFWDNTEKSTDVGECWHWFGSLNSDEQPVIRVGNQKNPATRARKVSLFLAGKEVPTFKKIMVICNNPLCVNPSHLVCGDEARFWSKVQKLGEPNGCWVWIACQDDRGYGSFSVSHEGKVVRMGAHVYSWQLFAGRPVPDGILVCHDCDHPYCVNPTHLFLGTNLDNMQDMKRKGRQAKGEKIGKSKLTEDQVREIRILSENGVSQSDLSRIFDMAPSSIRGIISRKRWRHVV